MKNLTDKLEFQIYKQLILDGQTHGRNIIIERKDGTHEVSHQKIKPQHQSKSGPQRKARVPQLPGTSTTLDEIERITIFVDGCEYEFVACQ